MGRLGQMWGWDGPGQMWGRAGGPRCRATKAGGRAQLTAGHALNSGPGLAHANGAPRRVRVNAPGAPLLLLFNAVLAGPDQTYPASRQPAGRAVGSEFIAMPHRACWLPALPPRLRGSPAQ
jgi:hypothetical protein